MKNINEHDKIENLMGMLDDSIISEYLARRETASVKRRRPIRAVLIAAAVAVLCAIPLAMALMLRDDTPTPPVVIEGEFNILSVDAITDENGFIAQGKYVSSFVGFFPANEPKYLTLVIIDEPTGQSYGSIVAAPYAKLIFEKLIAIKDVPPAGKED